MQEYQDSNKAVSINTKHNWQITEILELYNLPFMDLMYKSHGVLKQNFPENDMQISTLLNIKTGACPEDCKYCAQSARYQTVTYEPLMTKDEIISAAKKAKANGASRYCMAAAWRSPRKKDLDSVCEAIKEVKKLGLETCASLGMLSSAQAEDLKKSGLDYYNHNLDTSEEFYPEVATTRTYLDRLDTLACVRQAGLKVCCGGILGLGETKHQRAQFLQTLANMTPHLESVPINLLSKVTGTPMENNAPISNMDLIRSIAVARIIMPKSRIRLSAGRDSLSDEAQTWCYFAGANSIFYGEKLLTVKNPIPAKDLQLLENLGIKTTNTTKEDQHECTH
jgi:biotin synthase